MTEASGKSFEGRELDRLRGVRKQVLVSKEFQAWRDSLPNQILDGEKLYFHWGDTPRDDDQVIYEWAVQAGLIPDP